MQQFFVEGLLTLKQIIGDRTAVPPVVGLIPISKSAWWAGVKFGKYPKPVRIPGLANTFWRRRDILELISSAKESDSKDPVRYAVMGRTSAERRKTRAG